MVLESDTPAQKYDNNAGPQSSGVWVNYGSGFTAHGDHIYAMNGVWYGSWNNAGGITPVFMLEGDR